MEEHYSSAVALARRHGQEQFPQRPIWCRFPVSVERRIRRNPLGAIVCAAHAIEDRESLYAYLDALPVPENLRRELRTILMLNYQNGGDK